jgi:hypothetical protein
MGQADLAPGGQAATGQARPTLEEEEERRDVIAGVGAFEKTNS